jgi:hypothetical protein
VVPEPEAVVFCELGSNEATVWKTDAPAGVIAIIQFS